MYNSLINCNHQVLSIITITTEVPLTQRKDKAISAS